MSFFCGLPFIEVQSVDGQHGLPCCVFRSSAPIPLDTYFDNEEILSAKKKLLAGQAPTQCSECVRSEQISGNSFRKLFEKFHEQEAKEIQQINDYKYFKIKNVSFITSNICNLKCLPCSNSSYVRDLELSKLDLINKRIPILRKNNNFENMLSLDFERLTILGGEPFYDRITFDFLQALVEQGKSRNIQVDLNTNMTAITQEKMEFLVSNFRKVMIKGSIDGIGPVNDYLRYPSQWDDIKNNIDLVQSFPTVDLVVTTALSNLSLIKYYELIRWAAETRTNLFITPVTNPIELRSSLLPPALKSKLLKIYQDLKVELTGKVWDRTEFCIDSCIKICSDETDLTDWPKFIEWVGKHDSLRGTSLTNVFEELLDYVK